jgi:putative transcriptional regulator
MTPRHHPSDALLFAYAGGALSEGLALVVASHLALCPDCRGQGRLLDYVGGALLETLPEVPVAPDALARTLARLDGASDAPPASQASPAADRLGLRLPEPLAGYIRRAAASWRFIAPGIHHCVLLPRTASGGIVQLLKIAAGRVVSPHSHGGTELTLVLEGGYDDETGRFDAGDLAEVDESTTHQPAADRREGCICLVATEAPTHFKSLIGRLFQPLVGL